MEFVIVGLLKILLEQNVENYYLTEVAFLTSGFLFLVRSIKLKFHMNRSMPLAVNFTLGILIFTSGLLIMILKAVGFSDIADIVNHFFSAGIYFSLFVMSAGLLFFKKHPFTMAYLVARGHTTKNDEMRGIYFRAMCELSAIWAIIFLVATSISILGAPIIKDVISFLLVVGIGTIIGRYFPKWRIHKLCTSGRQY